MPLLQENDQRINSIFKTSVSKPLETKKKKKTETKTPPHELTGFAGQVTRVGGKDIFEMISFCVVGRRGIRIQERRN